MFWDYIYRYPIYSMWFFLSSLNFSTKSIKWTISIIEVSRKTPGKIYTPKLDGPIFPELKFIDFLRKYFLSVVRLFVWSSKLWFLFRYFESEFPHIPLRTLPFKSIEIDWSEKILWLVSFFYRSPNFNI